MSPKQQDYHPLRRSSTDEASETENENGTKPGTNNLDPPRAASPNPTRPHRTPRAIFLTALSFAALLLSCSNITFLVHWLRTNLHRTIPLPIQEHSPSVSDNVSDNVSAVAHLWEDELSGDPGVVALENDFVREKHLPEAMPFPWDPSKSVYLLQGYHNLHCLRTLFRYAWTADRGLLQRIAFSHVLHCLDQLRQDVICNADDTPRYAGHPRPGDPPGTGAGQVRLCRDWAQLERWARERTACFKHEDEVPGRLQCYCNEVLQSGYILE
ncbi:uncharacterized protein BO72DRAFT_496141 [Aspergillus fijiensis CBS 313.89]|uniref:Tat pathway signal sequence n=1 Tax=Aspergillus fijiensis CBS 313.89 TaxID=1448319 RepID=A0A8G1VZM6_9EURO|nr:uncharacterized protein BO72DRAFT_496141 [Aspergillus fijiensis CBS 313.89]RAK77476.1 hypothetical protein BO72DRAFT_496141 [Aspergillus fijiensis CBS 313.89]